jgi:hypothetical protein
MCASFLPNHRYVKIHYRRVHPDMWQQWQARITLYNKTHFPNLRGICPWLFANRTSGLSFQARSADLRITEPHRPF